MPRRGTYTQCSSLYPNDCLIGYSFIYVHTTCLNLSEALSGHYPFDLTPRLHSLRSLSLGLRRVYLSEALCGFRSSAYPPGCTRFARLAWGYRESASEAVRYPFNAWCRAAAGVRPSWRLLPKIFLTKTVSKHLFCPKKIGVKYRKFGLYPYQRRS